MVKRNDLKLLAALAGASGVILGAFGAHALEARLAEAGMTSTWETAVLYHLVHSVALLAVAMVNDPARHRLTAILWGAGILLFSGSLYGLSLGGPGWLGPVTPLGGLALIAGWILIGRGRKISR